MPVLNMLMCLWRWYVFQPPAFLPLYLNRLLPANHLIKMNYCWVCWRLPGFHSYFILIPSSKQALSWESLSAFLGGLFTVYNRLLMQEHKPETVTLYQLSGGFLFLTILVPFYLHYIPADHIIPTMSDLGWLLVLALFCTVWAYNLSMNALNKISAFTVNLSYNLEPLYGIATGVYCIPGKQIMSNTFYIGLMLIVLSVFLQTALVYRSKRRSKI